MGFCLRVLHKLKLVHKDIKPVNIMFSETYKDYVLLDFGLAHVVREELGNKTLTHQEGTKKYMSAEML